MLRIRAVKIEVNTSNGIYGFESKFSNGLNIIRGNNTSGKSTLINSMIYAIGMEELLGGRNESVLPYSLRTHLIDNGVTYPIISSQIILEIENGKQDIISLRRAIISEKKNPKLIEIIKGPYITEKYDSHDIIPTYVHDAGSAQSESAGFYKYLEMFLGLNLPSVSSSQGGETKLYLQTIFAALIVEQKQGWTDYIANIPYFRIKNAEQKVVEYLLGFDIFENELKKNELNNQINSIKNRWNKAYSELAVLAKRNGIIVKNISVEPADGFASDLIVVEKISNDNNEDIHEYLKLLINQYDDILEKEKRSREEKVPSDNIPEYEKTTEELNNLAMMLRALENDLWVNKQSIFEFEKYLVNIKNDIEKNNAVLKIKNLGFEMGLQTSKDICPTCQQKITDSLIQSNDQYVMSIEENIKYLKSQQTMIGRHCNAKKEIIQRININKDEIKERIKTLNQNIRNLQTSIVSSDNGNVEIYIREKIILENTINEITDFIDSFAKIKDEFDDLKYNYILIKQELAKIPKDYLSPNDNKKIEIFKNNFIDLAKKFEYSSTTSENIFIDESKYIPFMRGDIIQRDLRNTLISGEMNRAKLKNDSSASDFVRLIWSYLISLFKTSNQINGNHFGFLIFDEPAQHSMAVTSLHSLLTQLSHENKLQSIISASFDDSDDIFNTACADLNYTYIYIEKLLKKVSP